MTRLAHRIGQGPRRLATCCAFVAMLWIAPLATAQQSADEFFKPIVTQRQFTELVRNLDIPREQRMIVELVFTDYLDAVNTAMQEADAEADRVGRRLVLDALAGRRLLPPDDLRWYRLQVMNAYRPLPQHAHDLAERLLLDLRGVLRPDQRSAFDEQMSAFRRALYLHPRHQGRGDYEYAGEGVDVLLLARDARREDGELNGVPTEALQPILDRYESELDALIRATAVEYYQISIDARIARISRDENAAKQAEQRSLTQWRSLHELNRRTVEAIGELAARHAGDDAQHEWLRRFERETFTWMFTTTTPDRIIEWMRRQELAESVLVEAEAIHGDYEAARWPLLQEAADIMIRARSEFETVVYSMMDPSDLRGTPRSLYQQLLLNSGRLATVEARAAADLEALLDDTLRRRMRMELRLR